MSKSIPQAICTFWERHPALFYSTFLLFGVLSASFWQLVMIVPLAIFWLPLMCVGKFLHKYQQKAMLAALIFAAAFTYTKFSILLPAFDPAVSQQAVKANFSINTLRQAELFGKPWSYLGKANLYLPNGQMIGKNVPCTLHVQNQLMAPRANCNYQVEAILKQPKPGIFMLRPEKYKPLKKIPFTYSLAEGRYHLQQQFASYIKANFPNKRCANFLIGISTGDFQDRLMSLEFSRFGLQHIMAISGFHFSILAAFLALIFSFFCAKSTASYLLLFFLTAYFLGIGPQASVLRAFISTAIALLAVLAERKSCGLNSMGLALMIILICDPAACSKVGFQFSFAATAGILLLYSFFESKLQRLFPKRPLAEAVQMSPLNQSGYIVLSFFRQSFSLGLAVNAAVLPLTIFHFHTFPWMSLFYNVFFPFLVAIALLLLIVGSAFSLILPPLATLINQLNGSFTHFILEYTHNMPLRLDLSLKVESLPVEFIVIGFTLLFLFGICYTTQNVGEQQRWSFL